MSKMAWFIAATALVLTLSGCRTKAPDLTSFANQVESITVYNIEGLDGDKHSAEALAAAEQVSFDVELFQELAPSAQYRGGTVIWKGSRLAVVKLTDGSERRLALSYYGSFFKVLGTRGIVYFEGEAAEKWDRELYGEVLQVD